VSLSDIVQFVGTSSVPVVVAGTVLGVFELGEKLASQRAKDALSNWLLTFDVRQAGALPDETRELFERIFGRRHFSLKCFIRSAVFSLSAMVFFAMILFLIYPGELLKKKEEVFYWLNFAIWLPWSILIDYVSLFKTRFILGLLTRIRRGNGMLAVAIVGADYFVFRLLMCIGIAFLGFWRFVIPLDWNWSLLGMWVFSSTMSGIMSDFLGVLPFFPHDPDLFFILFWSGFAPSLWMWLYVLALFVTRTLLRSERILNWLRWFLDVDKAPFRSIGAVAAALAFIVSVAILLISAEISRITAAT
jgi:hypothetical protein